MIFDFDNTFFIHFVLFVGIMVLFFKLFAYPWLELQTKREAVTAKKIERAEKLLENAATLDGRCQVIVNEAKAESLAKRSQIRLDKVIEADARRVDADRNAAVELEDAEREIMFKAWKTRRGMHDPIEQLATSLSSKMLGRDT